MKKWLFISCFILFIVGCTNNETTLIPSGDDSLELTKLANDGITDQQPANQAKQFLSEYEEVSAVRAVNHDNQLVVAVDIFHHDRFSLNKLEKQLTKDIKKNFSDMHVTLSTDQKILLELKRLENDITANAVKKDEIKKRLHKIKKLSREET